MIFDINKVLDKYSVDLNEVANILFPNIRYKNVALSRLIKGETELTLTQLSNLAKLLNISTQELFEGITNNSYTLKLNPKNNYILSYKGYEVKLYNDGSFMSLYKDTQLIKKEFINAKHISLDEVLKLIDNIIKNNN